MEKLTRRKRYRFQHQRKGTFEGIYLGMEKLDKDDPQDKEVWKVAIDTADGSGSEWLRRVAGATSTQSGIRPSLVESVEEVES